MRLRRWHHVVGFVASVAVAAACPPRTLPPLLRGKIASRRRLDGTWQRRAHGTLVLGRTRVKGRTSMVRRERWRFKPALQCCCRAGARTATHPPAHTDARELYRRTRPLPTSFEWDKLGGRSDRVDSLRTSIYVCNAAFSTLQPDLSGTRA